MTKQELIDKIAELKKQKDDLKDLSNVQDLRQHAYKIFLNSSYGALGSAFYPCFDLDNAEAVTLSGQSVTREMVRFTNEILNKLANSENDEFVVAGDTDSVSAATLIKIFNFKDVLKNNTLNSLDITIENLFNLMLSKNNSIILDSGTEVVNCLCAIETVSINGISKIKNISRHKVTKEKWLISVDGINTYFTKDHSIMVLRNSELISIPPGEIQKTDTLLKYNINDFELIDVSSDNVHIECVGMFEDEYVYDLEVENGNHTFVANNILAHNSCVKITKIKLEDSELTIEELFNLIFDENNKLETLENGTEIALVNENNEYTINGLFGKTNIKNVSRRKVTKKCYKIEISDNEPLYITEDHSIIVLRNDELIECKANEILETDILIQKF